MLVACLTFSGLVYTNSAYAHTFSGDESASFLALAESIRVELDLVQSNLANNATISEEHAEHAHEHLDNHTVEEITERNERLGRDLPAALEDLHESVSNSTSAQIDAKVQNIRDLLDETVTVRVERAQLTNSTVQALFIANLADGVLEHYKEAYGIETEDEEHDENDEGSETTLALEITVGENNMTHNGEMSMENSTEVVNITHYQSALALATRTQQLFNDSVKELAPANSTEAVAGLEAGLQNLKSAIEDREPVSNVEIIVHNEVHPNLQEAYNLQIIPEFPLPLLMVIPAIASIIAITRLGALRRK